MNVHVLWHSIPEIGYYARTATKGAEYDMVASYIKQLCKKYSNLKKKHVMIFVEPQLDSGYPDIVIVEYFEPSSDVWNHHRSKLSSADLKILMHIQMHNSVSAHELSRILGFSVAEINKSFNLLSQSGLIYLSKTKKYARKISLRKWCRINKIIAIEAKMDKWSEALLQAEHNVWFATDSYIMLNKIVCNPLILDQCTKDGIGILLVNGEIHHHLRSDHREFPVSYASLQFNEWIQRYKHWKVNTNDLE